MLEKVKYINSKGEVLNFGAPPYFVNYNDMRDYKWDYTTDTKKQKIRSLSHSAKEKTLPVIIAAGHACTAYKNELFKIIEYDTLYNAKGKLFIGDYYAEGFFIGSTKSKYLETENTIELSLVFLAEDGTWKRAVTKSYTNSPSESGGTGETWLTYPYTYDYDYKAGSSVQWLENDFDFESDFIMHIYGRCSNPIVTIGGIDYTVNCEVYTGEILVINSKETTVIRYKPDGSAVDEFNNRGRTYSVFTKIPAGKNTLTHNAPNGISIDLVDERSEPLWTL